MGIIFKCVAGFLSASHLSQISLILGSDNIEKIINISSTTKIFERRNQINLTDLKVDQNIVTIGNPDSSGQINANFIRVMPLINNK